MCCECFFNGSISKDSKGTPDSVSFTSFTARRSCLLAVFVLHSRLLLLLRIQFRRLIPFANILNPTHQVISHAIQSSPPAKCSYRHFLFAAF